MALRTVGSRPCPRDVAAKVGPLAGLACGGPTTEGAASRGTVPTMSRPKRTEEWMLLAIGELNRLLSDMEGEAWPPPAWARYRLECALTAAEQGEFKLAYEVGLLDFATARR